jgi:hypothetical protein
MSAQFEVRDFDLFCHFDHREKSPSPRCGQRTGYARLQRVFIAFPPMRDKLKKDAQGICGISTDLDIILQRM